MQHRLGGLGVDALGQRRTLEQRHRMVGIVLFVHLEAHDLAAEDVEDHVQVEPHPCHLGRQERHVPGPHLVGGAGYVGGRRAALARRLGAAAVTVLPVGAKHAVEARFAG